MESQRSNASEAFHLLEAGAGLMRVENTRRPAQRQCWFGRNVRISGLRFNYLDNQSGLVFIVSISEFHSVLKAAESNGLTRA